MRMQFWIYEPRFWDIRRSEFNPDPITKKGLFMEANSTETLLTKTLLSLLWVTPTVKALSLELYSVKELICNINNNNNIYFGFLVIL